VGGGGGGDRRFFFFFLRPGGGTKTKNKKKKKKGPRFGFFFCYVLQGDPPGGFVFLFCDFKVFWNFGPPSGPGNGTFGTPLRRFQQTPIQKVSVLFLVFFFVVFCFFPLPTWVVALGVGPVGGKFFNPPTRFWRFFPPPRFPPPKTGGVFFTYLTPPTGGFWPLPTGFLSPRFCLGCWSGEENCGEFFFLMGLIFFSQV